jgi:hypothetical protein
MTTTTAPTTPPTATQTTTRPAGPHGESPAGARLAARTATVGGTASIVGVVTMFVGAAVASSTGTDLWAALSDATIADYLADATEHRTALFANLSLWVAGATALALGGALLTRVAPTEETSAALARHVYQLGGGLAVVSFVLWMGLVRVAAAIDPVSAELVGFVATRLDDLATICLAGAAPTLLALSAAWLPAWLRKAAIAVGITSVLSIVALFTDASTSYGFLIVPVGLLWTLAAGIAATRAR